MDIKAVLSIIGVIVGFVGFAPYLRDTFRGTTKPHFFSWFIWGILETIAFIAQVHEGAGVGAWVLGASVCISAIIIWKSFCNKDKSITSLDWFCFSGAFAGIILWLLTKNPTGAVIIVAATDAIAFVPTFRKSYNRVNEETLSEYGACIVKHALGILALESYSLATVFYPVSLVVTNTLFVTMVLVRRYVKK